LLTAGAASLMLPLAACTVGPNFVRPTTPTPAHWALPTPSSLPAAPGAAGSAGATGSAAPSESAAEVAAGAGVSLPPLSTISEGPAALAAWWTQFHDPVLSSLIERSVSANLDLRAAVLRIQEARTQRDISAAGGLPTVSANASYDRERISESTPEGALIGSAGKFSIPGFGSLRIPNPYNQYQLGAAASWEPDLFGRLRRSIEAANAQLQVSVEDQHALQVSLLSRVAQSYIALRSAQAREAIASANLATIDDLLDLTRQRRAAGLTTELDVRNALAQLAQTRASLPAFDLQISQSIHALGNLLGLAPEALRAQLASAAPIPPVPPQVPIGLPAQLARRRPDVRQAEASLHAATAQIGVAVGDLFPRLTLSASGGVQSEAANTLLHWSSLFGSVGPGLQLPVFDRGAWKTVHLDNLRAQEAALSYQATVLNALHEVQDAVAAYAADQQQRQWLTDAVAQNRLALSIAQQRYQSGVTDFLDVLDAQRSLQQNQLALLSVTAAVSTDLVTLYRTLGGGWSAAAAAAPAPAQTAANAPVAPASAAIP
jgi:NodT family efflux transporter outer membrane factor (OMF) lipoprotein